MFDIGGGEIIGLAILGMILVGPDRLPKAAADAARFIKRVRDFTTGAGDELKKNLGPGFEDLDIRELNPKTLIQKHVLDVVEDKPRVSNSTRAVKRTPPAKFDPDMP
ncbi:MAG: sec-independent translocase [Candidatus Nanopelagicaceae bacterium]|jgi:sec-independent protein translocase protein TatB